MWPGIPDTYQKLPESDTSSFRYTRSRDYETRTYQRSGRCWKAGLLLVATGFSWWIKIFVQFLTTCKCKIARADRWLVTPQRGRVRTLCRDSVDKLDSSRSCRLNLSTPSGACEADVLLVSSVFVTSPVSRTSSSSVSHCTVGMKLADSGDNMVLRARSDQLSDVDRECVRRLSTVGPSISCRFDKDRLSSTFDLIS